MHSPDGATRLCIVLICCLGDNMLTALSVARDCCMVDVNDNVVHLTVLPPIDSRPPHIEYTYTAVCKSDTVRCPLY